MGSPRKDLLSICNDQKVALDDFKSMFCDRCLQPECTRSKAGQSKFEKRIATWYDDLFAKIPMMDPSDPRFSAISAQKFITVSSGPVAEVNSAWLDPRDLTEKGPPSVSTPPVTSSAPPVRVVAPEPKAEPARKPLLAMPQNTPNKGPQMIGGAAPPAQVTKDPWAAPNPSPPQSGDSTDSIITPGATVKLGGSGSGV